MGFREREVFGYVFDGDGNPFQEADVKFQPTAKVGFTNTHFIVDKPFVAQTDSDGKFSITLWCDEDSNVPVNWKIYLPKSVETANESEYVKSFSLAFDDGSPIEAGYLVALNTPAPPPGDLLYQAVDERINSIAVRSDEDSPIEIKKLWAGSQAQYDALGSKNDDIFYLIV